MKQDIEDKIKDILSSYYREKTGDYDGFYIALIRSGITPAIDRFIAETDSIKGAFKNGSNP